MRCSTLFSWLSFFSRPPSENQSNAAKELARERSAAGAQEVDQNPKGGAGYEPAQADGEGQGYSMTDIVRETSDQKNQSTKGNTAAGEGAGVEDVE